MTGSDSSSFLNSADTIQGTINVILMYMYSHQLYIVHAALASSSNDSNSYIGTACSEGTCTYTCMMNWFIVYYYTCR